MELGLVVSPLPAIKIPPYLLLVGFSSLTAMVRLPPSIEVLLNNPVKYEIGLPLATDEVP